MKKIILMIMIMLLITGCGESPEDALAKQELRTVDNQIQALQIRVSAIPALKLSDELELDLKVQKHGLAAWSAILKQDEATWGKEYIATYAAYTEREADIPEPESEGPEAIIEAIILYDEVIKKDVKELQDMINVYHSSIDLARAEVKELPVLTIERTSKTEKYYKRYAEKKAAYEALAASLDSYASSDEFEEKLEKIILLSEINKDFSNFIAHLGERVAFSIDKEHKQAFPDIIDEAQEIEKCFDPTQRDENKCSEENFGTLIFPYVDAILAEYEKME